MSDQIRELITYIGGRLNSIDVRHGNASPSQEGYDKWKAEQAAYRAVIEDLVTDYNAHYRSGIADAYVLKIAGVRTSCTGGDAGLLTNWINAARRNLEQAKAGAA